MKATTLTELVKSPLSSRKDKKELLKTFVIFHGGAVL